MKKGIGNLGILCLSVGLASSLLAFIMRYSFAHAPTPPPETPTVTLATYVMAEEPKKDVVLIAKPQDIYLPKRTKVTKPSFQEEVMEITNLIEELNSIEEETFEEVKNPFEHLITPQSTLIQETSDFEILVRITEAEAGGEDHLGKKLVAATILNRVVSSRFPDTVEEVVFAKNSRGTYQYTPISNGRYDRCNPSESTIQAVEETLQEFEEGIDVSSGSTFFMAPQLVDIDPSATSVGVKWQQDNLEYVKTHGVHEFRRYR